MVREDETDNLDRSVGNGSLDETEGYRDEKKLEHDPEYAVRDPELGSTINHEWKADGQYRNSEKHNPSTRPEGARWGSSKGASADSKWEWMSKLNENEFSNFPSSDDYYDRQEGENKRRLAAEMIQIVTDRLELPDYIRQDAWIAIQKLDSFSFSANVTIEEIAIGAVVWVCKVDGIAIQSKEPWKSDYRDVVDGGGFDRAAIKRTWRHLKTLNEDRPGTEETGEGAVA